MGTRLRKTAGVGAALCLIAGAGCGDDGPGPGVPATGIRFLLPRDVAASDSVRVELWHRNAVAPPPCPLRGPEGAGPAAAPAQPDRCTRGTYTIRDVLGNTVKFVASEPWAGFAPGWDGRDDAGRAVSGGVYPVEWRCLDSGGAFTFSGSYYWWTGPERYACDWLVWSGVVDPAADGLEFDFSPFPVAFDILTLNADTTGVDTVFFANPYLVRVRAPGHRDHEEEISLVEGELTQVNASLPRLPDAPARAAGREP